MTSNDTDYVSHPASKKIIQIVTLDDEPAITAVISRIFRRMNSNENPTEYRIHQYQDGNKVLSDLSSMVITPSAFITSLEMNRNICGYEFITGLFNQNRTEPVIVFSSIYFDRSRVEYDGPLNYIQKPAGVRLIRDTVLDLLLPKH